VLPDDELAAVLADLMLTGNAYVFKVRGGSGRPVELWWTPTSMVEPRWPDDGSAFISHYEYAVDGKLSRVDLEDVIHIRQGFDPRNIRKGMSDLDALLREIATDNEAANWTATLLRNGAVPGVVIAPTDKDTLPTPDDLEAIKAAFMVKFGGDRRGEPLVLDSMMGVTSLSFNPEQMNLRDLRLVPEERITAVLGIPAIVVGLGAGLQRSTFANFAEAREAAYESFVIPMQRLLTAELQAQLVPDFDKTSATIVRFDLSEVRVLQADQNELHARAREDLKAGLVTLNQALGMVGLPPVDGDVGDARYIPTNVKPQATEALLDAPAPAAVPLPTPLRALPTPAAAGEEASRTAAGAGAAEVKAASIDDLAEAFESGLRPLEEELAADLLDAFRDLAGSVAIDPDKSYVQIRIKASATVDAASHSEIERLLRAYVLRGMRQAAQDLAPLTDGPVRIQRNSPLVREAVAEMEARLPGMVGTTSDDFARVLARIERRPGTATVEQLRAALLEHVEDAYPSRAAMIAGTELGYAHAKGVVLVAQRSGLAERVHLSDGDSDEACRARNGTILTLEEARGVGLIHPNCRLRFIPVVDVA
jgi:HK97 family phage portal protein